MDEDAELGILKPLGGVIVCLNGFPRRLVRACGRTHQLILSHGDCHAVVGSLRGGGQSDANQAEG